MEKKLILLGSAFWMLINGIQAINHTVCCATACIGVVQKRACNRRGLEQRFVVLVVWGCAIRCDAHLLSSTSTDLT